MGKPMQTSGKGMVAGKGGKPGAAGEDGKGGRVLVGAAAAGKGMKPMPGRTVIPRGIAPTPMPAAELVQGPLPPPPARSMLLTQAPAEWAYTDVEQMCSKYGQLDSVMPQENGSFEISFSQPASAQDASIMVHGVEVQAGADAYSLKCELLRDDRIRGYNTAPLVDGGRVVAIGAAQVFGDIAGRGPPMMVCADELWLSESPSRPSDVEVFLRNVPIQDYDEPQLREWLKNFGDVKDAMFLKDPETRQLTGNAYVSFSGHAQAQGLLDSINQEVSSPSSLSGTWSLSERALRDPTGKCTADIRRVLANEYRYVQERARIHALAFVCDRARGRLHFLVWMRDRDRESIKRLNAQLADQLHMALAGPGATTPLHLRSPSGEFVPNAGGAKASVNDAPKPNAMGEDWWGSTPAWESLEGTVASRPQADAAAKKALPEDDDEQDDGQGDDGSLRPCIFVQGFPDFWSKKRVRQVFELFGGATVVQFVEDFIGRAARVEMRDLRKMTIASECLQGKEVAEGQTLQCDLYSTENLPQQMRYMGAVTQYIFIDELPMPRRPEVQPAENDREVFVTSIPFELQDEAKLRDRLERIGPIEEMGMVLDNLRCSTAGAYVRFEAPDAAACCVSTMTPDADGLVASWSEAERASQGAYNVYRQTLQTAFSDATGRIKRNIVQKAKVHEIYMMSGAFQPRGGKAPPLAGKQLHFGVQCELKALDMVKSELAAALESFHSSVTIRLARAAPPLSPATASSKGKAGKGKGKRPAAEEEAPAEANLLEDASPKWQKASTKGGFEEDTSQSYEAGGDDYEMVAEWPAEGDMGQGKVSAKGWQQDTSSGLEAGGNDHEWAPDWQAERSKGKGKASGKTWLQEEHTDAAAPERPPKGKSKTKSQKASKAGEKGKGKAASEPVPEEADEFAAYSDGSYEPAPSALPTKGKTKRGKGEGGEKGKGKAAPEPTPVEPEEYAAYGEDSYDPAPATQSTKGRGKRGRGEGGEKGKGKAAPEPAPVEPEESAAYGEDSYDPAPATQSTKGKGKRGKGEGGEKGKGKAAAEPAPREPEKLASNDDTSYEAPAPQPSKGKGKRGKGKGEGKGSHKGDKAGGGEDESPFKRRRLELQPPPPPRRDNPDSGGNHWEQDDEVGTSRATGGTTGKMGGAPAASSKGPGPKGAGCGKGGASEKGGAVGTAGPPPTRSNAMGGRPSASGPPPRPSGPKRGGGKGTNKGGWGASDYADGEDGASGGTSARERSRSRDYGDAKEPGFGAQDLPEPPPGPPPPRPSAPGGARRSGGKRSWQGKGSSKS